MAKRRRSGRAGASRRRVLRQATQTANLEVAVARCARGEETEERDGARDDGLEGIVDLWHRAAMTADELRQLLRRSAFRPFTVFAEGKAFFIPHPEFAALTGPGKTLIVLHKDDNAFDLLDVDLIARVEVQEPRPST